MPALRTITVPVALAAVAAATLSDVPRAEALRGCPGGMALVEGRFCIDYYEASVDELNSKGKIVRRHSPYLPPKPDQRVVARVRRGVIPQAHFSQREAAAACAAAGKRLCTNEEWVTACKGKKPTLYPYGDEYVPKRCNDQGVSPLRKLHGRDLSLASFSMEAMNDPRLNQIPGSVARTGQFGRCRNSYGLRDMVGNLHEWTSDPTGTFRGGYYLDTRSQGEGCEYRTTGHNTTYHDYSIGFRCCKGGKAAGKAKPRARPKTKQAAGSRVHVVAKGHTLWAIARRYGVSVDEICRVNGIRKEDPLKPGQKLTIGAN